MEHKAKVTPKDFFLWVGAMVALYAGVVAFVSLIFDYINYVFPSRISNAYYYANPYDSISYEMASLIVLTPLALFLMRTIRKGMAADHSRRDIWIRRWALYLTVFIAGVTFVIDLIVLLNTYLQGEDLTIGFLLKVLTVLLVAGLGFMHFLADIWGYWDKHPEYAKSVNYAVGALIIVSIIAGFFIVGSPQEMRERKQDAVRLDHLQQIQWQIVNHWQQKERLPMTLADLNDAISGFQAPVDPKTGEQYQYRQSGAMSFELCATFAKDGGNQGGRMEFAVDSMAPVKGVSDNWQHGAGRSCFERTIDPELYPPVSKTRPVAM
ncbi:hypothetical protein C4568_01230 [Candidatus Parcubacteria bacterium]|nr:MAG: hypothetical protein C4568_01230 [Candidatus Parcubacteria bacterium]